MKQRVEPKPHTADLTATEVEALAGLAHARYAESVSDRSEAADRAFDDLTPRMRAANRDAAAFIPTLVAALGYRLTRQTGETVATAFTDEEIEAGARIEHLRWARFTIRSGQDDHRDLRPWSALPDDVRERDRVRVRGIPELLAAVGVYITSDDPPT